jgi:hypothetical protein
MFDYELQAEVKRVEALVPKVDGPVGKVCRITFRRELDEDIARAIGGEFGVAALKHLRDRSITNVVFPIDAITARLAIRRRGEIFGDAVAFEIPVVTGMKAIAKATKIQDDKDPDDPTIELRFQFPFTEEAWMVLGQTVCTTVSIKLSRNQLELPLGNGNGEKRTVTLTPPKKTRKRGGVLTTKSSHGDDRANAAGEITDDPQDAATPEEAEEIRAQRLREERGRDDAMWSDEAH